MSIIFMYVIGKFQLQKKFIEVIGNWLIMKSIFDVGIRKKVFYYFRVWEIVNKI